MTSIEMAIRTRLDVIFSKYTPNEQLTEFKEELVADLLDAYQDFAKQDKSHDEALDDAFAQLGDIDTILRELSQTKKQDNDDSKSQTKKSSFFEFSNDGLHLGNLHIDGQGVRLGDDIVIDGKHDKVQLGDWLHVDRSGARVGRKYYRFDEDEPSDTTHTPSWSVAHHNAQIPTSDKPFVFDYKNADVHFYSNAKADLITLDEFFSRDNNRYFADIQETNEQISVTQGDNPLLFHVRTQVNIGLPKDFNHGKITMINHSGRIMAQDLSLQQFNLYLHAGNFRGNHIQAETANWQIHAGEVKVQELNFKHADIFNKSGSLKLDNMTVEDSHITVTSGTVQISHFTGGGQFATHTGSLRLRIDKLTDDLKLQAKTGSIRVTMPESQDCYFNLSANMGSIVMDHTEATHFDKNTNSYKCGFYGDNPKFTIDANVDSGTIKVY
ncbi:DUF4097 domain-containing protein [Leuconostoc citreum]|uniref:DUF4097 domain-containing protein n=1 Tax=Leuconostoc citreum TaxID=33964 RepID=UPI0021A85641|nr:DUF4097 domain-containing protein [Leuconostoc citreum]MCT3058735.1 hypothetical protein [Leuconostoc citreum]MDM7642260.1 DUF4097 domain-containing protein [Leuconostoc citreum]MDY5162520.1 DUF4097 domain-containing protein [Leuconostoc citreum]MDY5166043.1 DUF4097 domain-containing protein [Leuconostoc citreum]